MELETLFTSSKWEIMGRISRERESPLQLAKSLNTTIANISQQLRLLEMAGLVKKDKLPNRALGKPRMLFSIKEDFAYLITCTNEGVNKKLIPLDAYQKYILNVFMAQSPDLLKIANELFSEIGKGEIRSVLFNAKKAECLVLSDKPKETQKGLEKLSKRIEGSAFQLRCAHPRDLERQAELIVIYDSKKSPNQGSE